MVSLLDGWLVGWLFGWLDDYLLLVQHPINEVYFMDLSDGKKCTCCHTEIEIADETCYLTLSHHNDTWPDSPSIDTVKAGSQQISH